MIRRKLIFLLSFTLSASVYGLFFAAAPYIAFVNLAMTASIPQKYYPVSMKSAPAPEPVPTAATDDTPSPASPSRKSSGILERTDAPAEAITLPPSPPVEIPKLQERAAQDSVPRDHDLADDPETGRVIDAKILEIDQDVARRDIQVARRFVRPSPERIVAENEFPVLRVPAPGGDEQNRLLLPPNTALMKEMADAQNGGGEGEGKPRVEVGVSSLSAGTPVEEQAPLPVVTMLEKEPAIQTMNEVKEEGQKKFTFLDDLLDLTLEVYQPAGEVQGYFQLRAAPKSGKKIQILPKDVTFVVDASNSIGQRKLDLTVRGLKTVVSRLRPEDRFNIAIFRNNPNQFQPDRVSATDPNKKAALDYLGQLQAQGETDVYQGMLPVIKESPRTGLPSVLLFISDGRPTTGMRDGRLIINELTADNALRNSIYAFSGGRTVNRYLLDLLACRNKGESHVSNTIDTMETELPKFFSQLEDPLLTDLQADYGKIALDTVFPKTLPDFYRGQAVTIYGRFDPVRDHEFVMRLAGLAGERKKEVIFRANFADAKTGDDSIARRWAFKKAYEIIGEISKTGETPGLIEQIRHLSQLYGIHTSYDE